MTKSELINTLNALNNNIERCKAVADILDMKDLKADLKRASFKCLDAMFLLLNNSEKEELFPKEVDVEVSNDL